MTGKLKIFTAVWLVLSLTVSSALLMAEFFVKTFGTTSSVKEDFVAATETANSDLISDAPGEVQMIVLTAELVGKHATESDCWMIIDGSVYSFTKFLVDHPGGTEAMKPFCGKDGSVGFATQGKNPGEKHSSVAFGMLNQYLIGKLGQSIPGPRKTIVPNTDSGTVLVPTRPPVAASSPSSISAPANLTLTASEVAKHNNPGNCWLIISGRVYNVTGYITAHPGGSAEITRVCGQDATTAFQTQDGKGSHSNTAFNLLAGYLLGNLDSTVSNVSVITDPPTANTAPATNDGENSSSNTSLPSAVTGKYPTATYLKGEYEDDGSWEGKVSVNGSCRSIKVSADGAIKQDERC